MPGVGKKDNDLKALLDGNKLDLSLMQLETSLQVRQIAALPKATELDMSCNRLRLLPGNFCTLTQITHLDLSKNQITELPAEIGFMTNLRHLDLSGNKIVSLPLGFSELENLRWLDLKDNPLEPHLSAVAGDCLDKKQCMSAAKQVKMYMQTLAEAHQKAMEKKKKQKDSMEAKKLRKKEEKEKAALEEQKAAKRAEKERRRREFEEKRIRDHKHVENLGPRNPRDTDSEAEVELLRRASKPASSPSLASSALSSLWHLLKVIFVVVLLSASLAAALIGWCQGGRRHSSVCGVARDLVQRHGTIVVASGVDFDDFCDMAANHTREALIIALDKAEQVYQNLKPWIDQVALQYETHLAPYFHLIHCKMHCICCDGLESFKKFLKNTVIPNALTAWHHISKAANDYSAEAAIAFQKHALPKLIIAKDHFVEVYLMFMERALEVFDLYVVPGCDKVLASFAEVYHNLKPQ